MGAGVATPTLPELAKKVTALTKRVNTITIDLAALALRVGTDVGQVVLALDAQATALTALRVRVDTYHPTARDPDARDAIAAKLDTAVSATANDSGGQRLLAIGHVLLRISDTLEALLALMPPPAEAR